MLTKQGFQKLINFTRGFSQTKKIEKYALMEHKEKGLLRKDELVYKKRVFDGINSANTNLVADPKPLAAFSKQHPKNLDGKDTYMVSYKRPPKPLTPRYSVPDEAITPQVIPFQSPTGSRIVETIFIGPPNSGKSSLINRISGADFSAVSDKKGTTENVKETFMTKGLTQAVLKDTPGATKANNSAKSTYLVSKCWNEVPLCDLTFFVIDSVKRLDFDIKNAVYRLSNMKVNLSEKRALDKMSSENFNAQLLKSLVDDQETQEVEIVPVNSALVMNKVDLVTNRRKFNYLRQELEDIGKFDYVFNVSSKTGFGMEELIDFMMSQSKRSKWQAHPEVKSKDTEVDKAKEAMKQSLYKNFYYELPFQLDIDVVGWTPKTNGELIVDYRVS